MPLLSFFKSLQQENTEILVLGGPAEATPLNEWALIGIGARQQVTLNAGETPDQIFNRLEQALQNARIWESEANLPFHGGLVAAFGYEFYHHCDTAFDYAKTPVNIDGWPTGLAQECEDWLLVHLPSQQLTVFCDDPERALHYQQRWQKTQTPDEAPIPLPDNKTLDNYLNQWQVSFTEASFSTAVDGIKQAIADGELYQANLSIRFEKEVAVNPPDVFETLCVKNPSPFSAYWQNRHGVLISNSPERLFRLQHDMAETRPIAGTRSRGKTPEEEQRLKTELLANEKERAEHLMLVDLERNDLGRVCKPGTVQVNELFTLESYSHVTHLVSNIQGQLASGKSVWDVLRATFPGGTITGCPKIRCITMLHQLEPQARGFYTGSLGYIDAATGNADFNILIRSLLLTQAPSLRYNARIQAGAGIVADSVGAYEYRESLKKAHAILGALHACEYRPSVILIRH